MNRDSVFRSLLVMAGVLVGAVGAFYAGTAARAYLGVGVAAAYAADPELESVPQVVAERVRMDDQEQGVLKVGEEELLRIQTTAGGLTGYERAMIVAKRINDALAAGMAPGEMHAEEQTGMWVVKVGEKSLVTVNPEEAELVGLSRAELAEQWASELAVGLLLAPLREEMVEEVGTEESTEQPGEVPEEVVEEPATEWQPAEPYKDKIVPIISVLEGTRVGIARVNGPQSAVNKVQAVAQLETHYKNTLEIDVYVPISTKVPGKTLARVQGVGVTGLGDLRI